MTQTEDIKMVVTLDRQNASLYQRFDKSGGSVLRRQICG